MGFRVGGICADIQLLRGMTKPEVNLILAAAKVLCFSVKSIITYQSKPANQLFVLCQGRARYFYDTIDGKKLILAWIAPGHIFGAAALDAPPSSYLVSTEAVRDSTVLAWDGVAIRSLARRFPKVMTNTFHTTIGYLSWYVAAHAVLTSQTARERLANILLGYAPSIGHKVNGGIELDVTNEELAAAANITLYTTSRIISEWQRRGAVRKHRGKIILLAGEQPLSSRRQDRSGSQLTQSGGDCNQNPFS